MSEFLTKVGIGGRKHVNPERKMYIWIFMDKIAYLSLADDLRAGLGDPGPLQRQLSGGWRPLQAQEVLTTVLDI